MTALNNKYCNFSQQTTSGCLKYAIKYIQTASRKRERPAEDGLKTDEIPLINSSLI